MKKQISFLCTFAIFLSIFQLPFSAFAALSDSEINSPEVGVEVELTPSDHYGYTKCTDDGGTYYEMNTDIADHALVFDYQIESGYDYYLTYDYKGPATNNWGGWLQGIGAVAYPNTTAAGNTGYNGNAIQFSEPNSTSEWSTGNVEILSGDKLLSTSTKNGTYLAITSSCLDKIHAFRNIKITKITADNTIIPTALGSMKLGCENGEIYWESTATTQYSFTGFKTNYELKPDTKYFISFDVKNPYGAFKYAGFYASPDSSKCDVWSDFTQSNLPRASFTDFGGSEWTTKNYVLDTASVDNLVTATNKYFSFGANIDWSNGTTLAFKNLTVYELGANEVIPSKFNDMAFDVEKDDFYWHATEQTSQYIGFNTDYELKPNAKYLITFDAKKTVGNLSYAGFFASHRSTECNIYEDLVTNGYPFAPFMNFSDQWTTNKYILETDDILVDGTAKYLSFVLCKSDASQQTDASFKNLTVQEFDSTLFSTSLFNMEFEVENYDLIWTSSEVEANRSFAFNTGYELTADSKYYIAFDVRSSSSFEQNGNIGFYSETSKSSINFNSNFIGNAIEKIDISTSGEWETKTFILDVSSDGFITDSKKYLSFGFSQTVDSDIEISFKNLRIFEINSTGSPFYTITEKDNRFWHWDADTEEHNLVENGSFDGEGGNWQTLLADGTITVYETENAKSGNKVLKFAAQDLTEKSKNYLYVECEPNTEYMLSVWHKGEKWSATNKNDLRWGIANPLTGELITERNLSCWDNEWHRTTLKFNSGNNTAIALAYIGGNSVAYIDDLQIFKYSDRANGRPTVMVQEQPTVTGYNPEYQYCDDRNNLFDNSGFEDNDISFWSGDDSIGYKETLSKSGYVTVLDWDGTVEICDSNSFHKNALYYTANDKYTGHPLGTSYLKYINVSPNTEYTFVADFRIDKAGNGRFGLVSVNDFYPRIIGEWITFNEENFDADYKWQTVSFTFNSNEFDKVAFVVQDKGGEAFIDNLRLFKISDGKALTKFDYDYFDNMKKVIADNCSEAEGEGKVISDYGEIGIKKDCNLTEGLYLALPTEQDPDVGNDTVILEADTEYFLSLNAATDLSAANVSVYAVPAGECDPSRGFLISENIFTIPKNNIALPSESKCYFTTSGSNIDFEQYKSLLIVIKTESDSAVAVYDIAFSKTVKTELPATYIPKLDKVFYKSAILTNDYLPSDTSFTKYTVKDSDGNELSVDGKKIVGLEPDTEYTVTVSLRFNDTGRYYEGSNSSVITFKTLKLGDVTENGVVDIIDLIRIKKECAKAEPPEYLELFDIDCNDSFGSGDLVTLRRILLSN